MINNRLLWETWERNYMRGEKPDFIRNLRLLEAMYAQARALGHFPAKDPLEGLETKIKVARILNVRTTPANPRPRT